MAVVTLYCPRCDREKTGEEKEAWTRLRKHVELAHPDYDPLWADEEDLTK
jgi:hypothetical protein